MRAIGGGRVAYVLIAAAAFALQGPASAEHFYMQLVAKCSQSRAEAFMDTTPPVGGVNKRPVMKVKAGDQIQIAWRMKSGYPHGTMKSVIVHFFVAREQSAGQKALPDLTGDGLILDNTFTMDFAPQSVSMGGTRLSLAARGTYLVRVQSENTAAEHDHEHFSALDIEVD